MRCHHFVLETFPEILESVFNRIAFKYEHILDHHLISKRIHLEPEASRICLLGECSMRIRVQQIIHFLIVQLYILNFDTDLAFPLCLLSLLLDLSKQLTDCSRDNSFFFQSRLDPLIF